MLTVVNLLVSGSDDEASTAPIRVERWHPVFNSTFTGRIRVYRPRSCNSTTGDSDVPAELTYDLMLEVKGVLRSITVRTKLDSDLKVGESFDFGGRRWVVSKVNEVWRDDLDRRVVAEQVDDADIAA